MQADEEAEKQQASKQSANKALESVHDGQIALIEQKPSGNNVDWIKTEDNSLIPRTEAPRSIVAQKSSSLLRPDKSQR